MSALQHSKENPVPPQRFDEEYFRDPYPTYTYLRRAGAMNYVHLYGGAWLVARFADVYDGLHDSGLSADRSEVATRNLPPEAQANMGRFKDLFGRWLLFQDPPRHTELRRLVNRSFTPRMMELWRPRIRELVVNLLEEVDDSEPFDLLNAFAYELPAAVIIEMLGVDRADQAAFVSWSEDIANLFGSTSPTVELAERAQESLVSMAEYFRPHLAAARKPSTTDLEPLVTILARAQANDETVTEQDLLAQCTLFLFAGHETTRNLIGSGVLLLLEHPEQLAAVRDDPELAKDAAREVLRFESPIQTINRVAISSGEMFGAEVEAGDSVVLLIGSANRDENAFEHPDRFDIFRSDGGKHVAFGHGPHFCLGAPLALIEGEIAFQEIIARWPDLRLADGYEPSWSLTQPQFRNLTSLRVLS